MEAVWVLRPFLGSTSSARPEKKGLGTSLSGRILENVPKSSKFLEYFFNFRLIGIIIL